MSECRLHCLKIQNIGVSVGGKTLLDGVHLHAHCGEMTALIGRNGAGKAPF
jgi:zinc transport system ATP-binding protein